MISKKSLIAAFDKIARVIPEDKFAHKYTKNLINGEAEREPVIVGDNWKEYFCPYCGRTIVCDVKPEGEVAFLAYAPCCGSGVVFLNKHMAARWKLDDLPMRLRNEAVFQLFLR